MNRLPFIPSRTASTVIAAAFLSSVVPTVAHAQLATATESFAIGQGAEAVSDGANDTAVGILTTANGNNASALGTNASADASDASAFGANATANANQASAFGSMATAAASGTSIGYDTNAASNATAIGDGATASSSNAIAIGSGALAAGASSTAIGGGVLGQPGGLPAEATGDYSTAVGSGAAGTASNTTSIGNESAAVATSATAIGQGSLATGQNSVALGAGSLASLPNTVSVGTSTATRRIVNVAPGSTTNDAATFGQLTNLQNEILGSNLSGDTGSLAIGPGSIVGGAVGVGDATAVGVNATATGQDSTAGGYNAEATGESSTAIGSESIAGNSLDSAFGKSSAATGGYSTALGSSAQAIGPSSTAIGSLAYASGSNSVALGMNSTAELDGTVSVGNDGAKGGTSFTRRITNVSAGIASTDAATVGQLSATLSALGGNASVNADGTINLPTYTIDGQSYTGVQAALSALQGQGVSYDPGQTSVTLGGIGATTAVKLTNVANGTNNTDAVNFGQLSAAITTAESYTDSKLASSGTTSGTQANGYTDQQVEAEATRAKQAEANNASAITAETTRATAAEQTLQANITSTAAQTLQQANSYTDQRIGQLQNSFDSFRQDTFAGIASALAVAGLPQPTAPGRSMVAVSGSTYHGQTGFAAGYSLVSGNENWVIKSSVTTNSRGDFGAVVSAGRQF